MLLLLHITLVIIGIHIVEGENGRFAFSTTFIMKSSATMVYVRDTELHNNIIYYGMCGRW